MRNIRVPRRFVVIISISLISCTSHIAHGAEGFDLTISGESDFLAGYVRQNYDTSNTKHVDFTNSFQLNIIPVWHSESGLEYGAGLRLRAYVGDGIIDAKRAYLFVESRFGRIEAGLIAGPNAQYGVSAPSNFGTGGVVGDWSTGTAWVQNQNVFLEPVFGWGFNAITDTSWATRLTYYTPAIFTGNEGGSGLKAAVSYAPQNLSVQTDSNRQRAITTTGRSFCSATLPNAPLTGCAYNDILEADIFYEGTFKGLSFAASLGYEHGNSPTDRTGVSYYPLSALQVGASIAYSNITIGGSYVNAGKTSYARNMGYYLNDQTVFALGILYEIAPFTFGSNFAHGEDAGDVTVPGKRAADLYSIGMSYQLAPGISFGLEYMRSFTRNEPGYQVDAFINDAKGTPTTPDGIGYGSSNAHMVLLKSHIIF